MKTSILKRIHLSRVFLILLLAVGSGVLFFELSGGTHPAYALPEYANRTGEPCGTCHVNPGGGGPRTLRGLLWAARGKPDQVPEIPGLMAAPAEITDGAELYDTACAGCHGLQGEGLFAINLAQVGVSKTAIRSFILRGITTSGMPSFENKFTDTQLEALVSFVAGLSTGEITLQDKYPLPPAEFKCIPVAEADRCGGQ